MIDHVQNLTVLKFPKFPKKSAQSAYFIGNPN